MSLYCRREQVPAHLPSVAPASYGPPSRVTIFFSNLFLRFSRASRIDLFPLPNESKDGNGYQQQPPGNCTEDDADIGATTAAAAAGAGRGGEGRGRRRGHRSYLIVWSEHGSGDNSSV